MKPWRLIKTSPARGAWNMAVDEAVLEHAGRDDVLPTLRLFAWDPRWPVRPPLEETPDDLVEQAARELKECIVN